MSEEKLLVVDKLRTEFFQSKKSSVTAINEISFYINKGEIVGLVYSYGLITTADIPFSFICLI